MSSDRNIFKILGIAVGIALLATNFYYCKKADTRINDVSNKINKINKNISNLTKNYRGIDVFLKEKFGDSYVFSSIYTKKVWGGTSGSGSNPKNAGPYIDYLQKFILEYKPKTVYDFGCGDWQIMSCIDIPESVNYLGCDVAKSVIDKNEKQHKKDNVNFEYIPSTAYFAKYKGDLLIVKDVLQHWNTKDIQYFIKNILPNFKYAIICNGYDPKKTNNNKEISAGSFSYLDLEAAPYNLKFKSSFTYKLPGETKKVYLYVNDNTN